jgi:beclin 1
MLDQSASRTTHRPTDHPAESLNTPRQGLSSTELAQNLHHLISSKTPISHPICVECITLLQAELQTELDELQRERDAYIAFEQGILRNRELVQGSKSKGDRDTGRGKSKGKVPDKEDVKDGLGEFDMEGTQEEWDHLIRRKKELAEEEEQLVAELRKRESELGAMREEEEAVKREEERVDNEEQECVLPILITVAYRPGFY